MDIAEAIITGGITAITTAVTLWRTMSVKQDEIQRDIHEIKDDLRDHILKHEEDFTRLEGSIVKHDLLIDNLKNR